MEAESYSRGSSLPPKGPGSRRRVWSSREEEVLLHSLKEIVQEGWKCENGFRTGYLGTLEKLMHRNLPNCDLRAEPHISSKIHVWKKNHGSLQCMLSRSGFSWNNDTNTINVESDSVWEDYIKTDTNAKTMRYKSYPFYKDWCEIFRKDRATGEHAEDLHAADNAQLDVEDDNVGFNAFTESASEDNEILSPSQPLGSTSSTKKKNKKRKQVDNTSEQLVGMMGKFCDQTNDRLGDIAKRIGYEFAMSEKREMLFDALGKLGVLSVDDQISVAKVLVNNNKDLELFFTLPEQSRARMVMMMVTGRL